MTTTDQDMRDQVKASIEGSGESAADYDVNAIVDELQQIFGTMDVENMPHDIFWGTVEKHSLRRAEQIAKAFHESYERQAAAHDYTTREASAKPWESVPDNNRSLMIAVAQDLLERKIIT